jgi:hypothetical protein
MDDSLHAACWLTKKWLEGNDSNSQLSPLCLYINKWKMLNLKIALGNCVNWNGVQFYNRDFIISICAVENDEIRSVLNSLESDLSLQITFHFYLTVLLCVPSTRMNNEEKIKIFRNKGNICFKNKKFSEAISYYKEGMLCNINVFVE